MSFMGYILIFITNPNKKVADKIALHLLKKRLIACANIFPITSAYWWKGKLEKAREWMLIAKSIDKNFNKIVKEVKKTHPYEVPVIEKISIDANKECIEWLKEELR